MYVGVNLCQRGLNPRPVTYKITALTTELWHSGRMSGSIIDFQGIHLNGVQTPSAILCAIYFRHNMGLYILHLSI